jgi:hypothetical protein
MRNTSTTRPNPAVLAYVSIVILLALVTMAWLCRGSDARPGSPLLPLAFWAVFTLAAELFWLVTPTGNGMVSMSLAVNIATLYVLPPHLSVPVAATATLVADLVIHRRGPLKASFNSAQTALTVAACSLVIRALGGNPVGAGADYLLREPLAVLAGPVLFFLLNTGLVAGVIGLHTRTGVARAWKQNYCFGYQFLSSGTLSLLGLVLVATVDTLGYIAGMLYLMFFFFVRDAYQRYVRSRQAAPVSLCRD